MTDLILPLANWGMGTALIIFFAFLCVGLAAVVVSFVLGGKKDDGDTSSSEQENL